MLWLPQAGLLAWAVAGIAAGEPAAALAWPALGVLALGLARAVLEAAAGRLAWRAARGRLSALRGQAVAALSARSPLDAGRVPSGEAASILAEQAEAVVPWLARFQPVRLKAAVLPLVILAAILSFSWTAAVVLLVAMPVIPVFMVLVGWKAKAASAAQMVEVGDVNAFLLDRLRGMATIRSLGAVEAVAQRVRRDAESLRARTMAVLRIAFLTSAVLELFAALGVAMVAVYIGFHLLGNLPFGAWGDKLTLAEGLFILLLAPAFFEPMRELSAVWHDKAAGEAGMAALQRLAEAGATLPGAQAGPPACKPAAAPALRIESLRFRHAGAAAPGGAVSLSIAPAEHVALVGPSGSGKSTLLSLIAGLALPDSGRILIDGRPLDAQSAAELRGRMAWIGQAPHIFAGSLAQNITLGRSLEAPDSLHEALRIARLDQVAARRGSAPIGEGGAGLSGGESLRLALARVAATPQAGLILADEPTAHLDAATAADITHGLLALARGRTLIVATHDRELAARMDRIIRLDGQGLEAAA
ncbi:ATP-binding cassette, subfamily C, CydD [Paracoccus thiocyanatus]|uniref:ATP-binding cassette, subfamily C, CydD n=2 Tax=Paracoccus thiocyanatus TaxID=34006 RepID=A0A1N6TZY6_9RHOB|nr:ATP-binding cassette, subfamily C, CydD [Paracoccus thiocyanatus]